MVWKLSAVTSASLDDSSDYCFIAPGAYKIGRKDCAVCITTDKTISRLHAEFIVRPLPPLKSQNAADASCEAALKDLSKFGTFVNKSVKSKPVSELPNKETAVRDGDEITFGTAKSTFRVTYEHFFFCISASQSDKFIAKAKTDLGAHCVKTWNPECTHVLVEDGSPVTELVLLAVCNQKPVVSLRWLEAVAASPSPAENIPDPSSFVPTLKFQLDNSAVKVVHSKARQSTFKNVVFLAGPLQQYFYKDNLTSIVIAGGGTLELLSKYKDSKRQQVIIVPHGATEANLRKGFTGFQHIQRVNESNLVLAVLCGCKENSTFFTVQSAAESEESDATVDLQDTDDDADSVPSTPEVSKINGAQPRDVEIPARVSKQLSPPTIVDPSLQQADETKIAQRHFDFRARSPDSSKPKEAMRAVNKISTDLCKKDDPDEYGEVVVLSLIVERQQETSNQVLRSDDAAPNFKGFRRVGAVAGNSFHAFVPFSPEAYGEKSYFDDYEESLRQARKQDADEQLADELFTTDDLKRTKLKKGESLSMLAESKKRRRK